MSNNLNPDWDRCNWFKYLLIMENKINIAELLKDCPKGMELDCTMYNNVTFVAVKNTELYPIKLLVGSMKLNLTKSGCYSNSDDAKCVIFPKGKTTWEGFHRPFEDGDILATNDGKFIAIVKKNGGKYYCCCHTNGNYFVTDYCGWFDRLATEEEKQKLFDAIKANGYKWNPETKTLEKLKTFKFAFNSIIRPKGTDIRYRVVGQTEDKRDGFILKAEYRLQNIIDNSEKWVNVVDEDNYELAPNKFDITTLKPFDKVLVRDNDTKKWLISFFSHCNELEIYKYSCINGSGYAYCIPYEANKELLDTTNDCDDFYKTWEK